MIHSLTKLYDSIEISVKNLDALGVTSGSHGRLLIVILLRLLPENLIFDFHRKRDFDKGREITDFIILLKMNQGSHYCTSKFL